jgi:hypothetical protein
MAQFRKRPVVVEAEQWFPGKDVPGVIDLRNEKVEEGWGVMTAHGQIAILAAGDYVVAEPGGRGHYPVEADIFETTYERVRLDGGY